MTYPDSVRGRIKNYLTQHKNLLQSPILEIGSKRFGNAEWWNCNRDLKPDAKWLCTDMQEGDGVDETADIHNLAYNDNSFQSVLCSEVLEHVQYPAVGLYECYRVLKNDGCIILTTLFSFPIHGYPNDYWRFTPEGMQCLLVDAGFRNIEVTTAGEYDIILNNIGGRDEKRKVPIHIFAVAQK
jgi:SAM-dependent methyltransferase